jgi:deoxyribose-phosphate aldolase
MLQSTGVNVCTVIGFPLGATTTAAEVAEARQAIRDGATELDMVIDIAKLKAGRDDVVHDEIASIASIGTPSGAVTKVILETGLLSEDEKRRGCLLAREAGAQFVKTSTGFSSEGATVADIRLFREVLGDTMSIKAAGGIRTRAAALEFLALGADRIGASASVQIVSEKQHDAGPTGEMS